MPSSWRCDCGAYNGSAARYCENCGAETSKNAARVAKPEGEGPAWARPTCEHGSAHFDCQICADAAKKGLAAMRQAAARMTLRDPAEVAQADVDAEVRATLVTPRWCAHVPGHFVRQLGADREYLCKLCGRPMAVR